MEAMRGLLAAVRRTDVCDHGPVAPTKPCVRPWLPYVRGSRGGACVRACSVDRSASRLFLRWLRLGEGGSKPSIRRLTRLFGPPCDFARLIREGLWSVNVRGVRACGRVKSPHKGGEIALIGPAAHYDRV